MFKKIIFISLVSSLCTACATFSKPPPQPVPDILAEATYLHAQDSNLQPRVAQLALLAYNNAQLQGYNTQHMLTIVDYTKPSGQKRLWVVNVDTHQILFNERVAHGRNSGDDYATKFSDRINSLQSSLGVYLTDTQAYNGHYGYALRVHGLEPGFNKHADERAIVVHGASYVTDTFVNLHGQAGRSWGCFALSSTTVKPVIDSIKGGTVIFAYYPDRKWLKNSNYLKVTPTYYTMSTVSTSHS